MIMLKIRLNSGYEVNVKHDGSYKRIKIRGIVWLRIQCIMGYISFHDKQGLTMGSPIWDIITIGCFLKTRLRIRKVDRPQRE